MVLFIGLVALLPMRLGLDLLGLLLMAAYGAVFGVLSLLTLHFNSYTTLAAEHTTSRLPRAGALALLLGTAALLTTAGNVPSYPLCNQASTTSWADLVLSASVGAHTNSVSLPHWLFFRFFLFETLMVNAFLMFALTLCVYLLLMLGRVSGSVGSGSSRTKQETSRSNLTLARVYQAAQLRRQVRRKHSSALRHPS